jgi:hypothetical protein
VIKTVKSLGEQTKQTIQLARRQCNTLLRKYGKSGVSEDEVRRLEQQVSAWDWLSLKPRQHCSPAGWPWEEEGGGGGSAQIARGVCVCLVDGAAGGEGFPNIRRGDRAESCGVGGLNERAALILSNSTCIARSCRYTAVARGGQREHRHHPGQ